MRTPRTAHGTTLLPAFLAVASLSCRRSIEEPTRNPPGPLEPATDAGGSVQNPPVQRVDPQNPPVHMMGAVAPVRVTPPPPPSSALPSPAAAPSAAAPALGQVQRDQAAAAVGVPSSGLPSALAANAAPSHPALAGREPGVYLVHNHPPGTPCRPVAVTDVQAAAGAVGAPR
ncbi:MAG: hypothetical protein HY909_06110 [Deltaproteobacteria bacterium]|nr:hypothetical protein [Deltaproteobacteria bacterium]